MQNYLKWDHREWHKLSYLKFWNGIVEGYGLWLSFSCFSKSSDSERKTINNNTLLREFWIYFKLRKLPKPQILNPSIEDFLYKNKKTRWSLLWNSSHFLSRLVLMRQLPVTLISCKSNIPSHDHFMNEMLRTCVGCSYLHSKHFQRFFKSIIVNVNAHIIEMYGSRIFNITVSFPLDSLLPH